MAAYESPEDLVGKLTGRPAPLSTDLQKQAAKGRDQNQLAEVAEETWDEFMEEEYEPDAPIELLKDYIKQAYEDAKGARTASCVDENILKSRRLVRGEYTRQELALLPEIDVWFHLVAPLTNIALAFLRSILQGDVDNPLWDLEHSPIPQLPDFIVDRVGPIIADRIEEEAAALPGEFTDERALELIDEYRARVFEFLEKQADHQTRNLKKEVSNNLEIADFYHVIDDFLKCISEDITACIKGPVTSVKKIPEWKDGKKVFVNRRYQHYEVVDIIDFFPSPDSRDVQSGSYVIHLKKMTRRQLVDAMSMDGFIPENIDIILCEYETRSRDWLNPLEAEANAQAHISGKWRDYDGVDVIEYHGLVPGHVLKKSNINTVYGERVNPKDSYEMEIWMTCDHIIRAVDACNEMGRPFACASLFPNKNSIWGESIALRAEDEQRAANAALRGAIRDIGYTSGPQVQVDVSFLEKNQHVPHRFHAGSVTKINSRLRGAQGKAITFEQLPTQAPLFLNMVNTFFQNAELNTGFNRQMLGQAQTGIGTLGEANILQGNAITSLRSMLVGIDRVIEFIIEMTACQIMATTEDPALKADARVIAKGSSHLLDRQLNKQNLLQLFNSFLPASQTAPGLIEPYGMACLVREIASSFGQDPDKFAIDPTSVEALNAERLARQQAIGAPEGGGIPGSAQQAPQVLSPQAGLSPQSPGALQ